MDSIRAGPRGFTQVREWAAPSAVGSDRRGVRPPDTHMTTRRFLLPAVAAALALLAFLAWRLAAGGAEPAEPAGTPQVVRLPLSGQRRLVEVPAEELAGEAAPAPGAAASSEQDGASLASTGSARAPDPRSPPVAPPPRPLAPARPAAVERERGVHVAGLVLVRGEPLGGACVRVVPADEERPFRATVRTDAGGRYAVRVPRAERYAFEVWRLVDPDPVVPALESRYEQSIREAQAGATLRGTRDVHVPAVRAFTQDLAFGLATVLGTVRLERLGEGTLEASVAMSLVEVQLESADGERLSTTASGREGRYELQVLTPATCTVRTGLFDLHLRHLGVAGVGHASSALLDLGDGDRLEIPLDLARGAGLKGRVVWPDSTPGANAWLHIAYRGEVQDLWIDAARTAEGGQFSLGDLPPGTARVLARDWTHERGILWGRSEPFELVAGETHEVEVVLDEERVHVGLRLDGIDRREVRWTDAAGFPLPIAPIWTEPEGAPLAGNRDHGAHDRPPDGLGWHLPPGTYVVHARRGCDELERTIRVTDDGPQEFRIGF